MKKLTYCSNDYCWAVYLDGKLLVWGKHDDDKLRSLKRAGEKLNFEVEYKNLPDLDGSSPAETLD